MSHPVVWFEVLGKDGARLRSFYAELFNWKINADNPMEYGMVEAEKGQGIPGGIGKLGEQPHPRVTFYVATPSIEESLARAKKLGGKVLMPRTPMKDGPVLAMFTDPAGNGIGLVEEEGG